jgi:NTP pyrophosphatase (non-canonical NTP hydrolase)
MSTPIDVKHLGKLAEELNEAGSAVARCLIQGIEESEPVTRKSNREWLEDELADVMANIDLVAAHFGLDLQRMRAR